MKYDMTAVFRALIISMAAFFFVSCGHLFPKPPESSFESLALAAAARRQNAELKRFKGVGAITITRDRVRQSARAAWAADVPGQKIRIHIFDVSGIPVADLSSDGRMLYVYLNESNKYYRTSNTDTSLKRFLSVPATVADLIQLLAGRAPERSYDYAELLEKQTSTGIGLNLKTRWGKSTERIFWNQRDEYIERVDIYQNTGELAFQVEFDGVNQVRGYKLPGGFTISNAHGEVLRLRIDRYIPDVSIPDSTFVIKKP